MMYSRYIKITKPQWSKYITIGVTILVFLIVFFISESKSASALTSTPTSTSTSNMKLAINQPNEIIATPYNNGEEQIKDSIANDQMVISKWALFADQLGFSWCNGTKSPNVGEDFSVTRAVNGDYILQANYNANDPYAGGERADERLRIVLSNFKITFNSGSTKWGNPIITKSVPLVDASYSFDNTSSRENSISKEYQYSNTATVNHAPGIEFGDTIKLTDAWSSVCNFGDNGKIISLTITPQDGWKAEATSINGSTLTAAYKTNIPPHTKKVIEKISQTVQSEVNYNVVANISYNVSFHGFLRKTGNAKIDHPTNGPTIDLGFGDDKKSAADNVWDLYNHGSISGYNTWIDWNWIKNNYPNYIDVIENKIHNSPEFVNVLGKFTYNYSTSSMRDGLTSPLYPLSTINATGNIPTLKVGDSFDLRKIVLIGKDTKNFPYYNFNNLPITWIITSGGDCAYISGSSLIVKGEGYGTVVAVVQGVKSNQIGFNTGNSLLLKNLRIEGSIPGLYKGDSYDLSKLVLKGTDQYGNPVNISGQYVAWTITSGNNLGFITGNILKAEVEGTGTITANILGIISNKIYFTIKSRPYLKSITLSNTIPVLYVGDHYDLTKLTLVGKDQYGNAFNIAGQPLTWNILSGGSYFNISNNILTANSAGSGVIRVTVNGINSNQISISILNPQGTQRILSRLVISGVIPTLYTGNNYDLSRLTLTGYDQYDNYYNLYGQSITWSVADGWNSISTSSNILIANNAGSGTVVASVNGITSNRLYVSVLNSSSNTRTLTTLTVRGTIPSIYVGESYNLSNLTLTGYDQYGYVYNISGLSITWSVKYGWNSIYTSGNILVGSSAGIGQLAASVNGIESNQISVNVINNAPVIRTLSTLVISGTVPSINIGSSYDLSSLTLTGYDQYNNYYNISGLPVTWTVTSGWNAVSISNNILRANAVGSGQVTATINGIISSPITVNTVNPLVLKTLKLGGANGFIPTLNFGEVFDLSKLSLKGADQNGNAYNISGLPVTWSIATGNNLGNISGNTLKGVGAGTGSIVANVSGIASNPINFVIKDPPALKTITLIDTKLTFFVGKEFDLSQLQIKGIDQYGNPFNISGLPVIWSLNSNKGLVGVMGNSVKPYNEDFGSIIATIQGVVSNQISFNAVKEPRILKTLTLTGIIPELPLGKSFDLTKLGLVGSDQYGDPYSMEGQTIIFSLNQIETSGALAGNILTAKAPGVGLINASVKGISSNYVRFTTFKEPSVINSLIINGTIPNLKIGVKYDLSKIKVNAIDQYGNPYDISSRHIAWRVISDNKLVYITGSILTPTAPGKQIIVASLGNVSSKPIDITIKTLPILKSITINNSINTLIAGSSYDLTNIALKGFDQYGAIINISGKPITWKVTTKATLATINGKILKAKAPGTITIAATIQGITSKPITLTIKK